MKLQIDSREDSVLSKAVIENCQKMNIQYEKEWLEIGDYIFDDVCFEAKSTFDFLQSVMSKRLWNQIDNMDRAYMNNIVIVHGSMESAISKYVENVRKPFQTNTANLHRVARNKFYGAFGKIILDLDCNIIWTPSEKVAAKLIAVVCKMKPIDREVYIPRIIKKRKITTTDLRIDILTTIKGVSEKKAKILIEQYGSIMEIGETSPEEIQKLDGFGAVLAERIQNVLNSEEKQVI
jgi:ERCC4-type nuclease